MAHVLWDAAVLENGKKMRNFSTKVGGATFNEGNFIYLVFAQLDVQPYTC